MEFIVIMMILSFLLPKEHYQKYIQFMIGIIFMVWILSPIHDFLSKHIIENCWEDFYEEWDSGFYSQSEEK